MNKSGLTEDKFNELIIGYKEHDVETSPLRRGTHVRYKIEYDDGDIEYKYGGYVLKCCCIDRYILLGNRPDANRAAGIGKTWSVQFDGSKKHSNRRGRVTWYRRLSDDENAMEIKRLNREIADLKIRYNEVMRQLTELDEDRAKLRKQLEAEKAKTKKLSETLSKKTKNK